MVLLDGRSLSLKCREKLSIEVKNSINIKGCPPKLVAIIIGNDPASLLYVSSKKKACFDVGIDSDVIYLPENTSENCVIETICKLNDDDNVDGILVQLPLPSHIDKKKVICSINPSKDVDGFHPQNVGGSMLGYNQYIESCTPKGIMTILRHYDINLKGANVVIVGASDTVGKPLSPMFVNSGATITVCHILTKDLKYHTTKADILVSAIGKHHFITRDMLKKDVVVVDVGISHINGKIYGDVDFESVQSIVSAITPVPGGVGPMTITELLNNTFKCYKYRNHIDIIDTNSN